ncbi:MAG: helix-turn-helix transcriptional regulator [Rubrivivax sp.]|nr:helix-turn-helix transcriptional regulator [Rubrivivax sp.]
MVALDTPLDTASDRIAYAINASGKTLESIAAEMGCTHATLSQWQRGRTDPHSIKAGLLQAFSDVTGFDVRWLLTGKGPRVSRYVLTAEMDRISQAMKVMERTAPLQVETVVRMVEAAASGLPALGAHPGSATPPRASD